MCHGIGPRRAKSGQDQDRPSTVVCRFSRFKDKQRILNNARKLRNTSIFFNLFFKRYHGA